MAKLEIFAVTVAYGPYQNRRTYLNWAPLIYELLWYREFPDMQLEEPNTNMYQVVSQPLVYKSYLC